MTSNFQISFGELCACLHTVGITRLHQCRGNLIEGKFARVSMSVTLYTINTELCNEHPSLCIVGRTDSYHLF